jgi:hypothetical protein
MEKLRTTRIMMATVRHVARLVFVSQSVHKSVLSNHCIFYARTWLGWGPRWHSWLRHCTTNRQVAGSIPEGVSGFCPWRNPVGRTVALGSTQPLTETNISWGVNAAGAYG